MRKSISLAILLMALAPGTLTPGENADKPASMDDHLQSLLAVDQAFSDRAQKIGVPAAFLEFATDDAVMYRNGREPIVGKEAIATVMAPEEGVSLVWKPLTADVSASGDLGYTRGSFVFYTAAGPEGTPRQGPYEGYYVSIWKRQPDGTWKWAFDSGIISKMPPPQD